MAKPRPREQTYEFTDKPSYREWLIETVRAALPDGLELAASNYARSTASSYWLIKGYDEHQQVYWVTLRVATHRLWLQNAHQIEVLWEEPGTFGDLFNAVSDSLHPIAVQEAKFRLSPLDIAVLNLLITLEHHKLIWFIRMIPDIARAHKDKLFDLTTDFLDCQLLLGDRNNANNLLLPIDVPAFQKNWRRSLVKTCYSLNLPNIHYSSCSPPINGFNRCLMSRVTMVNGKTRFGMHMGRTLLIYATVN